MKSENSERTRKKSGPIVMAVAIAIVAVVMAYCYSVVQRCQGSEFNLAGLLSLKLQDKCKTAHSPDLPRNPQEFEPGDTSKIVPIDSNTNDFPCKFSWIFLGKYSHKRSGYQEPEFKYALEKPFASPFPAPGEKIVVLYEKNLLVTDYGVAAKGRKCDGILNPPWKYRPETAKEFIAGTLAKNKVVVVNLVQRMPYEDAEPEYIWALVGPIR